MTSIQIDGEGEKHEEKLSRIVGLLGPGKEPPVIRPKPKPTTKPKPVHVAQPDQTDSPSENSPGAMVCHHFTVTVISH